MSDDEIAGDWVVLLNGLRNKENAQESIEKPPILSACSVNSSRVIFLLASLTACIGGILFGYDFGIISGALLQLEVDMHLGCKQKQFVVSSLLLGALLASCVGGFIIDYIGRKWTIIANSFVFVCGAILIATSQTYNLLITGRCVLGFAVALSAISECIYISEISPPNKRGLLVGMNELGITLGFLSAYLINYVLASTPDGWRYMFAISAIPAILQALIMAFLPQTPQFLMLKKQEEEAEKVLGKLRKDCNVHQELANIRHSLASEKMLAQGCCVLYSSKENMRLRMFIGIGLVLFQQLTGQPNVLYYSSLLFQSVGFCTAKDATFASVIMGAVKLIATICSMFLVDRLGRRILLLLGAGLMAISIGSLGVVAVLNASYFAVSDCQVSSASSESLNMKIQGNATNGEWLLTKTNETVYFDPFTITNTLNPPSRKLLRRSSAIDFYANNNNNNNNTSDRLCLNGVCFENETVLSKDENLIITTTNKACDNVKLLGNTKWVALTSLLMYVASYSIGFGPVTWLVLSEIYPTALKGRAMATATVFNWGANIIISSTFLDVMGLLGVGKTFLMYSGICILSAVFVFLIVPETKNKTLAQLAKEIQKRLQAECFVA